MSKDVDIEMDSVDAQGKIQFNTSKSLLWILTRDAFDADIKKRYEELRDIKFYDYDNLMKYFERDFMDKIPKSAYNRDAKFKYIDIDPASRSQYMFVCNGDRRGHLRRWLKDRLIFMDSLMGYTKEFFSGSVTLRVNKLGENTIGIKTFTPQYVSVEFQQGVFVRKKVTPNEFTYFTGMVNTSTDQEVFITNAPFLKEIDNIRGLNVSRLYLEYATRLTKLDCAASSSLQDLRLGNNPYLRELNCSNCAILGSGVSGGALNLQSCLNLMTVDCSNTQITSIILPTEGGAITEVVANNCSKLGSFSVANQVNLRNIELNECRSLATFAMESCDGIEEFTLPESYLESFEIAKCSKLHTVDIVGSSLLRSLKFEHCNALTNLTLSALTRNDSSKVDEIDLSTIANLENLTITNAPYTTNLRLPIVESKIKNLRIENTGFRIINYGEIGNSSVSFDMGKLNALENLNLKYNRAMTSITNINYTKENPIDIFNGCSALTSVTGKLTLSGSINSLFSSCGSLEELPAMDFSNVTSASGIFRYCNKLPSNLIPVVINSFGNPSKLKNGSSMFAETGGMAEADALVLPSNLITSSQFPELTDVSSMFIACSKVKGALPSDLFGATSSNSPITNASNMFWSASHITSIGGNILKPLKKLTNANGMFMWLSKVESSLPSDFFYENTALTNLGRMFYGCSKLTGDIQADWFKRLVNATNMELTFAYCSELGNSNPIPDGLLSANKKVTTMDGMFINCVKISGDLPSNLLNGDETVDITNRMALQYARAMFYGCTGITGNVPLNFFKNCYNLSHIGKYSWRINVSNYSVDGGIFSKVGFNTSLREDAYGDSIFKENINLQYADNVFLNCTSLVGSIPDNLFKQCTKLREIYGFFRNCSRISGSISPLLITRNTLLINTSDLFNGCIGLSGAIPEGLFNGLTVLDNASGMFKGCENIGVNIPTDLFRGLVALKNVSSLFEGCIGLSSAIPVPIYREEVIQEEINGEIFERVVLTLDKKGLFEDCVNLNNVNNLFKGCRYIEGSIPEHLFRQNTGLINAVGVFYNCNRLRGDIPSRLFEMNEKLIDISEIFYHCNNITGSIPYGLFDKTYNLEKVNRAFAWCRNIVKSSDPDDLFCVPENLFDNCASLTEADGVFEHCTKLTGNVPHSLFYGKSRLTTIRRLFTFTNVTGTVYTTFIGRCNALKTVECFFDTSKIQAVESGLFTRDMRSLTDFKTCFRACSNLAGSVPMFENHSSAVKTGCYNGSSKVNNYANLDPNWKVDPEQYHNATHHSDPFGNVVTYPDEYEADDNN